MAEYDYRIVNVFAGERLAANPLVVFEDALLERRGAGEAGKIFVAGRVAELGRGTVSI